MDTERNKEFFDEIKKHLTLSRFYHSLNVAYEAKKLAARYGADDEKAFTAGLLHDIMKDTPHEKQREMILADGGTLSPTEEMSPKTWHQRAGEVYMRTQLHITDKDILSAVRYHTTGKWNMTLFEKVLYIADYISADRKYPGVEDMRKKAYEDIDEAMLEGLQFTIVQNVSRGLPIHEDSIAAFNSIAIQKGRK